MSRMSLSAWLLFCAMSLITAFTPGPAVLLAVSNAATLGMRRALVSSAGNAAGVLVVSATAMLGLGALLKTSAWAFGAVKVAGAAYLIGVPYLSGAYVNGAAKRVFSTPWRTRRRRRNPGANGCSCKDC
jgi:threonine/homoserine/homoserine lactone efflux protein